MRWRVILPVLGLGLFAWLSYQSFRASYGIPSQRYFWWSAERLDRDPLNRHPREPRSCDPEDKDCPIELDFIWIEPGWIDRTLLLSALPAFIASLGVVYGLARLGVSEVTSFMISTPVFIFAWFYFVGWLLDSWRNKRILARATRAV